MWENKISIEGTWVFKAQMHLDIIVFTGLELFMQNLFAQDHPVESYYFAEERPKTVPTYPNRYNIMRLGWK